MALTSNMENIYKYLKFSLKIKLERMFLIQQQTK